MSINAMANAAAARRPDVFPFNEVPLGFNGIALAAAAAPVVAPASPSASGAEAKKEASSMDTAYNIIFGHIPTEVLTLYVAVLAAIDQTKKVTPTVWTVFWCFLIATPIVVWLVYGAKLKEKQKPLPVKYGEWPVWEMFAATVAYCAWAFALPRNPFLDYSWYSSSRLFKVSLDWWWLELLP